MMNKVNLFGEMVSVDAIGRAPGCGPGSWGFESPPTPHMDVGAWFKKCCMKTKRFDGTSRNYYF